MGDASETTVVSILSYSHPFSILTNWLMEQTSLLLSSVAVLLLGSLSVYLLRTFRESELTGPRCVIQLSRATLGLLASGVLYLAVVGALKLRPNFGALVMAATIVELAIVALIIAVIVLVMLQYNSSYLDYPNFKKRREEAEKLLKDLRKGKVNLDELLNWLEVLLNNIKWVLNNSNDRQLWKFLQKPLPEVLSKDLERLLKKVQRQILEGADTEEEKKRRKKLLKILYRKEIAKGLHDALEELKKKLKELLRERAAIDKHRDAIKDLIKAINKLLEKLKKLEEKAKKSG